MGNHILVATPILALSQIGGPGDVWGVCGGESRGVSVGMSGVGRSGRVVSLCALGIFGGSGRGLRVILGVEKGSGGLSGVSVCVAPHTLQTIPRPPVCERAKMGLATRIWFPTRLLDKITQTIYQIKANAQTYHFKSLWTH